MPQPVSPPVARAMARRPVPAAPVMAAALLIAFGGCPPLLCASDVPVAVSDVEKSLGDLEASWARLAQDNAADRVRGFLLSEFVLVDAAGALKDRREYLNDLRSGKLCIEDWRVERWKARVLTDTAVVTSTVGVIGRYDRRDISAYYQITDVFVRRPEGWRVVSRQQTKIASRTDPLQERVGRPDGSPRVVLFVQGSFCPHCMTQLQDFARELAKRKYRVTVVSADTEEDLKKFPSVPFTLIADPQHKLFRRFGAFQNGPRHATLALDGTGKVVFSVVGDSPYMKAEVVAEWADKAAASASEAADDRGR